MAAQPTKEFYDFLDDFSAGVNTGVAPRLLVKQQLAWGINISLRGGFVRPRPPYMGKTLASKTPGGGYIGELDPVLQTLIQKGLFQGAGYYRPDFGTEIIIAVISGHVLTFTETNAGGTWVVEDVSISGNLLSASVPQVWMWQAEKWMIINDGTGALPYIFNGTTSRRSTGASVILGTIASDYTSAGIIGQVITLTLNSPYTGAYNVPVIFNGEFYMPVSAAPVSTTTSTVFSAVLLNVGDTPGASIPTGTAITNNNLNSGNLAVDVVLPANQCFSTQNINSPKPVGDTKIFVSSNFLPAKPGYVTLVDTVGQTTVFYLQSYGDLFYPGAKICAGNVAVIWAAGQPINYQTPGPSVTLGITALSFTVPAVGSTVTVQLAQNYSGPAGQNVLINGKNYTITSVPVQPPVTTTSNTFLLINQTDTKTNTISALAINGSANLVSVPELPGGRMGAYGMGCVAMCLANGIQYVIGDVIGAASGTQAENYRDAVLKMTQNTFLQGGGAFSLPVSGEIITAMLFPPILDASLGQGPLEIGTEDSIFSNYVVGTYPGIWDTLTSPIQTESLKDNGPLGQNSTVLVNSDTFFRSGIGIGSLILARRDFNEWGNKPISNELQKILNLDNQTLLQYGSAISFDNRFLSTAAPNLLGNGIFHVALTTLNFDLLTSLRGNQPPAWEGAWTGINALQILTGKINGSKRAFAFSYNTLSGQTEFYEYLPEATTSYADNDTTSIQWIFETPVCFNKDIKDLTTLIQLKNGEVYLSDIIGTVNVQVFYRPDYYPSTCWVPWTTFNVCQSTDSANSQPGWRMRIGLGEPDVEPCEIANNRPLREGYFFQFRFVITGYCVFKGMRVSAVSKPQPQFAPVLCDDEPCQIINCVPTDDIHSYSLQSPPPPPVIPTPVILPPVVKSFTNQIVYFSYSCSLGTPTLAFSATTPTWITLDSTGTNSPGNLSGLIGAAGIFSDVTQADANAAAQAALNTFGNTAVAAGTLYCTTPAPADLSHIIWNCYNGGDFITNTPGIRWNSFNGLGGQHVGASNYFLCDWNGNTLNQPGCHGIAYCTYFNNTGAVQHIQALWAAPSPPNPAGALPNFKIGYIQVAFNIVASIPVPPNSSVPFQAYNAGNFSQANLLDYTYAYDDLNHGGQLPSPYGTTVTVSVPAYTMVLLELDVFTLGAMNTIAGTITLVSV